MEAYAPQLRGVLEEFRIALREEIFAAQRSSSSNAVPLSNGRKIGQAAAAFQYAFSVDSVLNVPDDAPGDLIVPGKERLPATIVSMEGLTITISVAVDLGNFVSSARLQTDLTFLLRKLIERIELLNSKTNSAGDRILGLTEAAGVNESISLDGLNAEQNLAVGSSIGRDTTFIWGPPGTGKTKTIGGIGETLFNAERSLLLVSHTNTAVDGAMIQIAERLGSRVNDGAVIRIGVPKDERLRDHPELLLETHVEKRSAGIRSHISALEQEQKLKREERHRIQRLMRIWEWLEQAPSNVQHAVTELATVQTLGSAAAAAQAEHERLVADAPQWKRLAEEVLGIARVAVEVSRLESSIEEVKSREAKIEQAISTIRHCISDSAHLLECAKYVEPLRAKRQSLPSLESQTALLQQTSGAAVQSQASAERIGSALLEAEKLYDQTCAANRLARMMKRLPQPEQQQAIVSRLKVELSIAESATAALKSQAGEVAAALAKIQQLDETIAPYSDVLSVAEQSAIIESLNEDLSNRQQEHARASQEREAAQKQIEQGIREVETFETAHGCRFADILAECRARKEHLDEQNRAAETATRAAIVVREALESFLRDQLQFLFELELSESSVARAEDMLQDLHAAHAKAITETAGTNRTELSQQATEVEKRIQNIAGEITSLSDQLKRVEDLIISEARIIATTLTRAYLRDSIQQRRFDTVLLDEASMAPIPALWVAASLADRNVIAVGDFKQLPPIVQSNHELAQKWLGQDVFRIAGIESAWERQTPPAHFVALSEQHRMHPDIRVMVNELFYNGFLRDAKSVVNDTELDGWYRHDWGNDSPVLLVDTGTANAWVTSVAKGRRASRLNFLSATVCVDLAEQLLLEAPAGRQPRILIISPYAPHAKLLKLLIKTQNLDGYVEAGTVHSFQGSEAPVVIIDLVNDEPHWRVGLFMPDRNNDNKRLLNVAITRARRRLIVVGDFDYCQKRSNKSAFLGRDFLPFLRQFYKRVNAVDLVPAGISSRAAQVQSATIGGPVEPSANRLVFTQKNYYPMLFTDISRARKRVVIYSPFITANRLATLEPQIKAAKERGIRLYVITKPHAERGRREIGQYQMLESALIEWGAVVIHKIGMHEKLVFIDDEILWSSSLNPLSYSDTQEIVERRESREVVKDYRLTLRLDELVGAYDMGHDKCPVCGDEMMPAEGADDPFYWRCAQGCYTRSIDDPPLQGGVLTCANCCGPIEFGEWGGKPAWRCVKNKHHHQRLHRNHLRLPAMRALVPKRSLAKLDKEFGILAHALSSVTSSKQRELF
jgi:hypothetical protein